MLEVFLQPAFWASVVLLVGMELVLSTDNMRFMTSMTAQLPHDHRDRIMRIGLVVAAAIRLLVLFAVVWVLGLERTAFSLAGWSPTWRELVLIAGGLFLVFKAVTELQALVEPSASSTPDVMPISDSLTVGVAQIVLVNAVLSVDAIVTAIGLSPYIEAMAIALVASLAILYFAADRVAVFVEANPSVKALTLGVLLMVGIVLVADGLGMPIWRPYLYAAIAFAVAVLAVAKVAKAFSANQSVEELAEPAPIQPRQEPNLEPVSVDIAEPSIPADFSATGWLEPAIMEPVEPVFATTETVEPDEIEHVELVADADDANAFDEPEILETPELTEDVSVEAEPEHERLMAEESDGESLGESAEPVQKSRTKRTPPSRRAERPRTGRRRE